MIIITAPVPEFLITTFQNKGFVILYDPEITYDQLHEEITSATGIVVTTRIKLDRPLLQKAEKLEWIGRLGSGMELIDIPFAESKNIKLISTPEGNRNAVAEHCMGMLLSLLQNIHKSSIEVSKRIWKRQENRGYELDGKTVGIIGYGNTGQRFSELLTCFNATVLAYDKYKFDFGAGKIKEANLDQIKKYSDVISFHLPLSEETTHFANEEFFAGLEGKPVIINSSRGKIIDTSALIKALKQNKISGAGLDVIENENLESHTKEEKKQLKFLCSRPDVIVTPHIAGYSYEAFQKMSESLLYKLNINYTF